MSRSGIMLCYPLEEKRLSKWNCPFYLVEPKLDGDRCRAILGKEILLLSSEENLFNFAVPHIVSQLENLKPLLHSHGIYELDGELYCHGLPHEDIHSIVSRSTNLHDAYQLIEYHVFDHIVEEIDNYRRKRELCSALGLQIISPNIRYVQASMVTDLPAIMREYNVLISLGYEGIIVRNPDAPYVRKRSTNIMKYKPKKTDTYTIVGWKEEISIHGEPKNRLGALILTSDEGTEFSVSAGLNDEDRKAFWGIRDSLIGKSAIVHYQAMTKYGTPKFATNIEIQL